VVMNVLTKDNGSALAFGVAKWAEVLVMERLVLFNEANKAFAALYRSLRAQQVVVHSSLLSLYLLTTLKGTITRILYQPLRDMLL
jgi:hypothetical protein